MEYQIKKDYSKKSHRITIISIFIIIAFLLVVYVIPVISGIKGVAFPIGSIIIIVICLSALVLVPCSLFLYVKFRKWKYPFQAKWDEKGATIRYPDGKTKKFYWKDVEEIKFEGENRWKQFIPLYWIGRFSWDSANWLMDSGRSSNLTNEFAFFHFRLKDKKMIFVPIPKESVSDAIKIISKVNIKSQLKNRKEVKSLSMKSKWLLIAMKWILVPIFLLSTMLYSSKNKVLQLIPIMIFAIFPILFLIFIIKSLKDHRILLGGWVLEGFPVYIVGGFFLLVDLFLFYIVFVFLGLA